MITENNDEMSSFNQEMSLQDTVNVLGDVNPRDKPKSKIASSEVRREVNKLKRKNSTSNKK